MREAKANRVDDLGRRRVICAAVLLAVICAAFGPAHAQDRYDDHELTDRFYITAGGYSQTDIRTTIRIDAKTSDGAVSVGTFIALESLFDLDNETRTGRIDGWFRINKKHRINWTYWQTKRKGVSTYNGTTTIDVGDVTISPGDYVATEDKSQLIAASWSYSFLNMRKYEAWFGAGLNLQSVNAVIDVDAGGTSGQFEADAKGTVPIPTINIGFRWNFNDRWRILLLQELFGLKIGDFSGKRENTRLLTEVDIIRNFGVGGGFERHNFEVEAEGENFVGQLDSGYSAFTLYLKAQW